MNIDRARLKLGTDLQIRLELLYAAAASIATFSGGVRPLNRSHNLVCLWIQNVNDEIVLAAGGATTIVYTATATIVHTRGEYALTRHRAFLVDLVIKCAVAAALLHHACVRLGFLHDSTVHFAGFAIDKAVN